MPELDEYIRGWHDAGKGQKAGGQSDEYYRGHKQRLETDELMIEVGVG